MDCPSCGKECVLGCILGDRYHLRWLPESRCVLSKVWAQGGIQVSEPRGPLGLGRPALMTYYCQECHLMFNYFPNNQNNKALTTHTICQQQNSSR